MGGRNLIVISVNNVDKFKSAKKFKSWKTFSQDNTSQISNVSISHTFLSASREVAACESLSEVMPFIKSPSRNNVPFFFSSEMVFVHRR